MYRPVAVRGERERSGRVPLSAGLPVNRQSVPNHIVAAFEHDRA